MPSLPPHPCPPCPPTQVADLILWVGISFEQSASVEYFRRVRHILGCNGRVDKLKQVRACVFVCVCVGRLDKLKQVRVCVGGGGRGGHPGLQWRVDKLKQVRVGCVCVGGPFTL